MRVRGKVVGNMVVLEEPMPEGTEVEVVTADEAGVYVDEATEQELAQAMTEADTEEGVSVEEAFARLPPRRDVGRAAMAREPLVSEVSEALSQTS